MTDNSGCGCCLLELLVLGAVCCAVMKACMGPEKIYIIEKDTNSQPRYIEKGVYIHECHSPKKVSSDVVCPSCGKRFLLQNRQHVNGQ